MILVLSRLLVFKLVEEISSKISSMSGKSNEYLQFLFSIRANFNNCKNVVTEFVLFPQQRYVI